MRFLGFLTTALILTLLFSCGPSAKPVGESVAGAADSEAQTGRTPEATETRTESQAADAPAAAGATGLFIPEAPVYDGFEHSGGSPAAALPTFHPLGWTPDGRFGFIEIREDSGRGGISAHLTVIDLVSDEVVLATREIDENHAPVLEITWPDEAAKIAGSFASLWMAEIRSAGIDPVMTSNSSGYSPLPVVHGGAEYFAMIDRVYGGEDPGMDNIEAYDFWLRGTDDTMKLVYSAEPRAVDIFTGGYFMSPYEPRAAVVILEERFTFEGTEPFAVITGCNMESGFEPAGELVTEPQE